MTSSPPPYGTKGTHVLKAREWIDGKLGPGSFERIVRGQEEVDASWNPISPVMWYSVPVLCQVLAVAGAEVGLSLQETSKAVAELNAQHDLRTLYKFFMSVLGPVKVMSQTSQMFRTYVNFGEVRVTRNVHGIFEGEAVGIPHRLTPWFNGITLGFLPQAIAAAGGRSPVAEILGGIRDQRDSTLYTVRYVVRYQ